MHAIVELDPATRKRSPTPWATRPAEPLHPESFEIVSVGLRDDSGKVRRTLLRDGARRGEGDRSFESCPHGRGRKLFGA